MNFKAKRRQIGIGSVIMSVIFGGIFFAVGLFIFQSAKFDESWTRTNGTVVDRATSISDGSTVYYPVIGYEVNGRQYKVTSNTGSSFSPNMGDLREIAYNPTAPQDAKAVDNTSSFFFPFIFTLIGLLMIVLTVLGFIKSRKRSKTINNLIQTGKKFQGVLTDIQTVGSSNKKNTYAIVVSAADSTGVVRNFTSDDITGIAGLAMADFQNNPIPIDVYVDPVNPENYYVDISDIPNLTPQRISELIKSANAPQPAPAGVISPDQITPRF